MISIAAIPISISPFFWLLASLIGWIYTQSVIGTLIWIGIISVSILIHEFGHALTARRFGQHVKIKLAPFGGLTERHGERLTTFQEFLIVFNGPLAGISFAGLAYLLFLATDPVTSPMVHYISLVTAQVNFFWTIVNLLPVGSLDGGQLIRISFQAVFGIVGLKFAHLFSTFIGAFIGIFFIATGNVLIGSLFFILTFESFRAWKQVQRMTAEDIEPSLQKDYDKAMKLVRIGNLHQAIEVLQKVRECSGSGMINFSTVETLALLLFEKGQNQEAYDLLKPHRDELSMETIHVYQQLAFRLGHYQDALDVGTSAYREYPDSDLALCNAASAARLGDTGQTIGWLKSAKENGSLEVLKDLKESDDFADVRDDLRFKEFINKLEK